MRNIMSNNFETTTTKTFFIADLHLGHKNILSYDNRPFKTIEEHDNTIINNWNKTVTPDDDIYILGDISWHNIDDTIKIFQSLHGKKHLIIGNHDKSQLKNKSIRDLFVEIKDYKEIILPDNKIIVLSHYPIPCFNKHYYGSYHLYRHVHNSFEENMMQHIRFEMEELYTTPCNMYNVGAMISYMNYIPRTLEEIIKENKS